MTLFLRALNIIACFLFGSILVSMVGISDVSNASVISKNYSSDVLPINKVKILEESEYTIEVEVNRITPIQLECLARNIYFEARGEGEEGMIAVAYTTLNRVMSDLYPSSICGVVYQGQRAPDGQIIKNKCQFSWVCDGKIKEVSNLNHFDLAKRIANDVAYSYSRENDPTKGSLYYHAVKLNSKEPFKKMKVEKTVTIGNHVFYKPSNNKLTGYSG